MSLRSTRFGRLCIAALVLIVSMCVSPTAFAHDQLTHSNPAQGERLEVAPTVAEISYSGQILDIGTELALINATKGEYVELPGAPVLRDRTVVQELPALEVGSYALNWRVVSEDGHPISGAIYFAVGTDVITDVQLPGTASGDETESADGMSTGTFVALFLCCGTAVLGALVVINRKKSRADSVAKEGDEEERN